MKKLGMWMFPAMLLVLVLTGCTSSPQATAPAIESWIHAIDESNYIQAETESGKEYLVFRYEDKRFNTTDWFDVWIIDWMHNTDGWSRFIPVMDGDLGLFMSDAVYGDGYVTWLSWQVELDLLVGVPVKFFRIQQ